MRLIRSLLLLFLLIIPMMGLAAPIKWYQVELLVFSHITSSGLSSEEWPMLKRTLLNQTKLVQLKTTQSNSTALVPYQLLPSKDFVLQREANEINRQYGYHILLHIAWDQPLKHPQSAKNIHIFGGNLYSNDGGIIAKNSKGKMSYGSRSQWQVDGTVKVSVRRFIDMQFNLMFAAPLSQITRLSDNGYFSDVNNGLVYFRLLQNRRMRSKELNYIDFPLYGILVKIIPVDNKQLSGQA